ncbi:MAG TPA: hypothetical protein DCG60_08155 [Tissierella sp.]|uniref:hypothetical protein n=1 Tax=Tissierella praeacuta TaxID=43131 RepID=UPI000EBC3028|nr:hypothetical protein [Tissierella praeacuta]HAE92596.1 hypothetical protein [Tissierella sp.]
MDDKVFDLMEKMYIEFSKRFDNMENDIKDLKGDVGSLKTDVGSLKTDVTKLNTKIEHDLMPKITALFDDYKQNSDKLDRIEKEVSKHEEIILRRVK